MADELSQLVKKAKDKAQSAKEEEKQEFVQQNNILEESTTF